MRGHGDKMILPEHPQDLLTRAELKALESAMTPEDYLNNPAELHALIYGYEPDIAYSLSRALRNLSAAKTGNKISTNAVLDALDDIETILIQKANADIERSA